MKKALTGLHRTYLTYGRTRKVVSTEKADQISQEILSEFESHRAYHHPTYEVLKQMAKDGFTPEQFLKFRDNYFFRTSNTIKSVASHISLAIKKGDFETIADVSRNFFEEGGSGNPNAVHLKLLEDSHNTHGQKVFGIPKIKIKDAHLSPFIIPQVREFRETQKKLFSGSYQAMTGTLLAHERMADEMLINFREAFFEPLRGYYSEEEYKELIQYFDVHRDDSKEGGNVEEEHANQALRSVSRMIQEDERNVKYILEGGKKFLSAQDRMWDGLAQTIDASKDHGQKVLPKPDFRQGSDIPSSATAPSHGLRFTDTARKKTQDIEL